MLRITEIFYSIQGESTHVGRRCVFVRLTGCNLRCVWCDSAYTFTGGEKMALEDVVQRVVSFGCDLVEITGGEPLAQPEAFELIRSLCDLGFEVLIETSGSIDIGDVDPRAVVVMDLKCPGSGEEAKNLWSNIDKLRPRDEIKFVIADRRDYEWARDVVRGRDLGRWDVLFSPVWGAVDLKDLAGWMLEDAMPARLQIQLHKLVWGPDVKGV